MFYIERKPALPLCRFVRSLWYTSASSVEYRCRIPARTYSSQWWRTSRVEFVSGIPQRLPGICSRPAHRTRSAGWPTVSSAFRSSPSHRRTLWTKHQSCAAQGGFGVHRLTVGAVHDAAFCETNRFLVKADRGRNVADGECRETAPYCFLSRGSIFLLCHGAPFVRMKL